MAEGHQTEPRLTPARRRITGEAAKRFKATAAAGDVRTPSSKMFEYYATEWLPTYRGRGAKGITAKSRDKLRSGSYSRRYQVVSCPPTGSRHNGSAP